MTLEEWRAAAPPKSRWRRRARAAIRAVVIDNPAVDPVALLAAVDHAYPFGERKYAPYKCWLAERKLFRAALAGAPELPSQDEADACDVARDMIEAGRLDDARTALEQAPNRLARKCPACGVAGGAECYEAVDAAPAFPLEQFGSSYRASLSQSYQRRALLVPHHARLVGHLDAGPLFGGGT